MDYTNMIKCALDGGASLDDITDALNVFNKQNQVRKARQQALDEIECDFLNAVDDEHIGQLAVLIYAPSHPEWDADTINKYAEAITETARIVGMNNINDALAATEEELDKIIEKAIQEMRNESVSVSIKSNNDEDVVAKFLRGLR
jgi:DNA-directed RNA polymerase subunit K/omega